MHLFTTMGVGAALSLLCMVFVLAGSAMLILSHRPVHIGLSSLSDIPLTTVRIGACGSMDIPQPPSSWDERPSHALVVPVQVHTRLQYILPNVRALTQRDEHLRVEIWLSHRSAVQADLRRRFMRHLDATSTPASQPSSLDSVAGSPLSKHMPNVHFCFTSDVDPMFDSESRIVTSHAFHYLPLLMTTARHVMLLRDTSMLMMQPSTLWNHMWYRDTGALLWPGFVTNPDAHPLNSVDTTVGIHGFSHRSARSWTQDDGLLCMDRKRWWVPTCITFGLAVHHRALLRETSTTDHFMRIAFKLAGFTDKVFHRTDIAAGRCDNALCGMFDGPNCKRVAYIRLFQSEPAMWMWETLLRRISKEKAEVVRYVRRRSLFIRWYALEDAAYANTNVSMCLLQASRVAQDTLDTLVRMRTPI